MMHSITAATSSSSSFTQPSQSSSGEQKTNQVILEAIYKTLEVIFQVRNLKERPQYNDTIEKRKHRIRFQFDIPEIPFIRDEAVGPPWKQSPYNCPISLLISDDNNNIYEHWVISYESNTTSTTASPDNVISVLRVVCKRIGVFLRALYSSLLWLPPPRNNNLTYNLLVGNGTDTSSLSSHYNFVPISTPFGTLKVSVRYCNNITTNSTIPIAIEETSNDNDDGAISSMNSFVIQEDYLNNTVCSAPTKPPSVLHQRLERESSTPVSIPRESTTPPLLPTTFHRRNTVMNPTSNVTPASYSNARISSSSNSNSHTPSPYGYTNVVSSSTSNPNSLSIFGISTTTSSRIEYSPPPFSSSWKNNDSSSMENNTSSTTPPMQRYGSRLSSSPAPIITSSSLMPASSSSSRDVSQSSSLSYWGVAGTTTTNTTSASSSIAEEEEMFLPFAMTTQESESDGSLERFRNSILKVRQSGLVALNEDQKEVLLVDDLLE